MTPEDKLIATKLLEKMNQWMDTVQKPFVIEDVANFCFGTRRDLDFKNGIASKEDIDKILKLGQQSQSLYSAWERVIEEAKYLSNELKNITETDDASDDSEPINVTPNP